MLQNFVQGVVTNYCNNQSGGGSMDNDTKNKVDFFALIVSIVVTLFLIAFLGKYLWNNYLVKYVIICKPIDSSLDLIALVLLFNILLGK